MCRKVRLSGGKKKIEKKEEVGRYVRLGEGGGEKNSKVVAATRWGVREKKFKKIKKLKVSRGGKKRS